MYRNLSRSTIIRTYVLAVARWALVGAFAAWALVTLVFVIVSHYEGMPAYSPLAWDGFLTLVCAVGAFIGGCSGVEAGQEQALDLALRASQARTLHDYEPHGNLPSTEPVPGNPFWRPEHDDATDHDYW